MTRSQQFACWSLNTVEICWGDFGKVKRSKFSTPKAIFKGGYFLWVVGGVISSCVFNKIQTTAQSTDFLEMTKWTGQLPEVFNMAALVGSIDQGTSSTRLFILINFSFFFTFQTTFLLLVLQLQPKSGSWYLKLEVDKLLANISRRSNSFSPMKGEHSFWRICGCFSQTLFWPWTQLGGARPFGTPWVGGDLHQGWFKIQRSIDCQSKTRQWRSS